MREKRTQQRAVELRRNPTDCERLLWRRLRLRQMLGRKFRRQVPIGRYVVDFACVECLLVVEADGGQHAESAYDARRDAYLRARGFRVLRFWNNQIIEQTDAVLGEILRHLASSAPPPLPSPASGGGRRG